MAAGFLRCESIVTTGRLYDVDVFEGSTTINGITSSKTQPKKHQSGGEKGGSEA